jgi:O-antigen/teichoic acid export membrane protein
MRLRDISLRRVVHGRGHAEVRHFGRSAGLLATGIGLAGLLTYLYFALASHQLDPTQYGEIVVLWSAAFVAICVLYRPVEQLLSRTLAEREAHGEPIGGTSRVAALIQTSVGAVCVLATLALREPLQDDLLSGNETLYWILVATLAAYAAAFFARGFLAGRRRFRDLAALILADSVTRVMFALAVTLGIATGQIAIAVGIAVAPCLCLFVVPIAMRSRPDPPPSTADVPPHRALTFGKGSDFAVAVFLIMLSEQIFLSSGPLLVQASLGAAAAGFIFNVIMLLRAPVFLFQGVALSLLPHLARLRAGMAEDDQGAFGHSIRVTLVAIGAFTALVCLVVLLAGPELMQIAFGDKFSYDRTGLLLVALAIGPYLAATTLSQAALARGQVRRAAACWIACSIGFLAWYATGAFDEFRRVEVGLVAAAFALSTLLYLLYSSPYPRAGNLDGPDSPAEPEIHVTATERAV